MVRGRELILEEQLQGLPETEVLEKLNTITAQGAGTRLTVKKEDNVIWFNEVRFNFKDGRLAGIGET